MDNVERNAQHGAREALIVDARVFEEARVLNRDEGVLHVIRDLLDRHEHTLFARELSNQRTVAGVNPAGDRRLIVLQIFEARQALQSRDQEDDHREHARGDRDAEAYQNFAPRNAAAATTAARFAIVTAIVLVVIVIVVFPTAVV